MADAIANLSGWCLDLPDHRDFTPQHEEAKSLLKGLKLRKSKDAELPKKVDWREYCPQVQNQQQLPTAPAHAVVGMLQYFERRSSGRLITPSRLFTHRVAHRLMQGADASVSLRATLKAIARFGFPPESYWPYESRRLNEEPDAFAYGFGKDFRDVCYVRLNARGHSGTETLQQVRSFLAAGFACVFGFPVCNSVSEQAEIAYPTLLDATVYGHAVVAVGYDDKLRIRSDKGALLVRNSWGAEWGDCGYGWLPYAYVTEKIAADFWTVLKPDWLASGEFRRPV